MIHYHGTPFGGKREEASRFFRGRFLLVPWARPEDLPAVAEYSRGFVIENSAYTAWQSGEPIDDWRPYYEFCKDWSYHPRFNFAIIPDVIDGDEADNMRLFAEWCKHTKRDKGLVEGAPVWHLHESLEYLEYLMAHCRILCVGSSGDYATPGTDRWKARMAEAMGVLCDDQGRPKRLIHGLRMLSEDIVRRYPFYSADSTNAVQNASNLTRFGMYAAPTRNQRANNIADRIEAVNSPAIWAPVETQLSLI